MTHRLLEMQRFVRKAGPDYFIVLHSNMFCRSKSLERVIEGVVVVAHYFPEAYQIAVHNVKVVHVMYIVQSG